MLPGIGAGILGVGKVPPGCGVGMPCMDRKPPGCGVGMIGGGKNPPGCGVGIYGMPGGGVDTDVDQVCPAGDALAAEAFSQRLLMTCTINSNALH